MAGSPARPEFGVGLLSMVYPEMPMPRANKDGTPAAPPRRRRLTEGLVKRVRPEARAFAVWDVKQRGLALRVQPTSQKSFKVVYSFRGKPRWLHISDASAISL